MIASDDILGQLDQRRRRLGMSCRVVAERSRLSLRAVQRLLSGNPQGATLSSVLAIAKALGAGVGIVDAHSPSAMRRNQARRKARQIAALTQGNAALEGQAVDDRTAHEVRRELEAKLLAGSPRRLWDE